MCVPDKGMLHSWGKSHRQHSGAPVWQRSLAVGHIDQVVFFKVQKGRLAPFCETEVLEARSFSTHPEYRAYLAEVQGLIAAAHPAVSVPVVEVVPVVEAPVVVPVVVDTGCW